MQKETRHLLLRFPTATMKSMGSSKKRAGSVEKHTFDYLLFRLIEVIIYGSGALHGAWTGMDDEFSLELGSRALFKEKGGVSLHQSAGFEEFHLHYKDLVSTCSI